MHLPQPFYQSGDFTMAYSVIADENINLFESKHGIIGYADIGGKRLFIGDPMCVWGGIDAAVDAFLEYSAGKRIIGLQCSEQTGRAFFKNGFNATRMGVEAILRVPLFDLKGRHKARVRRWINTARNAGIKVYEGGISDNFRQMMDISKDWLSRKKSGELKYLLRPLPSDDTPHARVFFAANDALQGFVVFDPMFRDGRVTGYYANICRFRRNAPNGTFDLIINEALQAFRAEGVKYLSFGLAPLADVCSCSTDNFIIRGIAQLNYAYGESMYGFKGIDFHKKAYHFEPQSFRRPVYFISKGIAPVLDILSIFTAVGIIPSANPLSPLMHIARGLINEKSG